MQYLEKLNEEQKLAVLTTDGPMMILAGAGSGKTRTIIARIVHLLKTKNIHPWEILAVTFSNRAANEMRERIHKELPELAPKSLNLSTFHAFCAKMLRYHADLVGLKSSFSIYDDSESLAVAKLIFKKHEIDPKKTPPSSLTHFIDQVKNTGYYVGRKIPLKRDLANHELWQYFDEYEAELKANNAVDFGSLITKCLELLENNPHVLEHYNAKYKYLLVDEYQDTNKAQFDLITLLGKKHQNVCVVGDSDQCVTAGTLITTDKGEVAVESLAQDDIVLSHFQQTEPTNISRYHRKAFKGQVVKITLKSGQTLTTTLDHVHFVKETSPTPMELDDCKIIYLGGNNSLHILKFFNYEKQSSNLQELYDYYHSVGKSLNLNLIEQIQLHGQMYNFKFTQDLLIGDEMPTQDGKSSPIIDLVKSDYEGEVFDLDISPSHNYIAGGIYTHNSIYSWRGAEIRNILDFEKHFPSAKILKLEENYRSSKNIIQAASEMIKRNIFRKDKNMFTNNVDGEKIKVYRCEDGLTEALFVAQSISKLLKAKVSPKEIAIFYRTNSQSRALEDTLRRQMIPYQIIGGLKFYERKEVKDVVAYMQLMGNPFDEISLMRIINTPARGIGDKSISKLLEQARDVKLNLFDYLKMALIKNPSELGGAKVVAGVRDLVEIITKGQKMSLDGESPAKIFDMIVDKSGYMALLKASKKIEDVARVENLQELKSSIVQFLTSSDDKTLTAYLETITLDRTEDNLDYGKVSLMTIHSSKGLEFDNVFLVGLEETIFPSGQSVGEGRERLEEERRLFYVAVTRARQNLSILYAVQRMIYGKTAFNPPSRFLDELPSQYLTKYKV